MTDVQDLLYRVHCARFRAHWGDDVDLSRFPWPKTPKEWRQTEHGAPWDANVEMARWHLKLAHTLQAEGLLSPSPTRELRSDEVSGLTYTITMSEDQARVLSLACETLARLGMGQVDFAFDYVPGDLNWDQRQAIKHFMASWMGFDHPDMSLGIRAASLHARRAWDLHAVIRQQIAMNNDFPEHDTWRREPDQLAGEALPKCAVA